MSSVFDARRAMSIARKETWHIRRDPVTLIVSLGLPVLLVLFFGFAINFDVKSVDLLVADGDHSRISRELIEVVSASGYFNVRRAASAAAAADALGAEKGKAALIIETGFGRELRAGKPVEAQVLLDGADNSNAGIVSSYLASAEGAVRARLTGASAPPVTLRTRFLFNPELDSHWFVVPGIFVIVVGLISSLLTALTVAREWENGSMEILLSTPVRPLEIIAGKLAPYMALSFAAIMLVYGLARLVFGVPFLGSHLIFALATLLFLAATMSQGLVISVVTRQQQLAFQTAMNTGMMPIQLLSGFIFPIESMPALFQWITMILPARWYMILTRSLFLRAPDFSMLLGPLSALMGLTAVFMLIAWRMFKTDLEP
ncbi:MAG: multidrug ABC transporter permease [Elusimicrobia bacterium CG11_big_fil_rev_8_21_14_0_20_64_6]|nr:MAG: multidrug ABC transporter permease [Elusimicrobia bacterium CG11_big_fil_rev_8_21_14_0_20_64_6]